MTPQAARIRTTQPRRARSTYTRLASAAGAAIAITAATTLATATTTATTITNKQPATTAAPALILEYAPMGDWLVDEKDAALRAALNMIPQRLRELTTELPDADDGGIEALESIYALLQSPGRLAITFDEQNQAAGAFGAGLVFSAGPMTRERSALMQGVVSNALIESGALDMTLPSEAYAGMSEMFTPVGLMRWGPRQTNEGWRYELHAGAVADPDAAFAKLPAPPSFARPGFRSIVRGSLDLAPAAPAINFFRVMAGQDPQAKQTLDMVFDSTGIIGENALRWTFHSGFTPDAMVTYTITERAALHPFSITTGTQPLTQADLAMIPIDATVAGATRVNKAAIAAQLAAVMNNPEAQNAIAQFELATGVNLNDDLLASLGDVWGGYLSETTGGGGLASAVLFIKLENRERFSNATANLNAFANAMAANALPTPYIRGRTYQHNNATLNTLTFAGIPIPLELTYTVAGDWLLLTFNPQAAIAAAKQATGAAATSILNSERFNAVYEAAQGGNVAFSYIDTARTIRDGYGLASLASAAFSNAVRSPTNTQREPGIILPPFTELAHNIRPTIQRTYWRGDDLVKESVSDRSVIASATATIGAASPVMSIISSSFIVGAFGQAHQRTQNTATILREQQTRQQMEPSF